MKKIYYKVTIDYEKKTTVICSLKELLKKLPKKSPKKPPKASSAINSITKFFNLIRNVKALIVAYIWRFIISVSFLLYAYVYASSKVETIATLVIDIFIAHISVNASLRMALELQDRVIHIIILFIVIILASCSFYIPILLLILSRNQTEKRIHLCIFFVILILDIIICSYALKSRIDSRHKTDCENIDNDQDKDKLVIKNYHTSIMIIKPENDLKNAYAYYKVSLYCAHLTLVIYCLFTAKWCFLTISKVDPTMLYDIIPWSLLLPLCTFFTIFIGARTLLNNAIILDCIIHILQILYILHQLLCLPFSSIKCNKLALSQTAQEGIEILSLQNFGLQILNVIDVISLLITVIVLMLLIYWWIVAFHRLDKSSRDSVESLKELKWHLEYVPAAEFEYEDCEDMYGNYLEKDLEEHAKKSPFLMYIPNLKT